MSADEGQGGEKSHDPTEQRLIDARKRGDIPRSNDISAFAAYLGLLIALSAFGEAAAVTAGEVLAAMLSRSDTLASRLLSEGGHQIGLGLAVEGLNGIALVLAVPFLLVLGGLVAQRAIVAVPDKLAPKLSRISPIEQAKQKFGITGLFEFAKSSVKLIVISVLLASFLTMQMDLLVGLARAAPKSVPGAMMQLCVQLLVQITVIMLMIAAIDYLWQRFDHRRKLRMSHQEIKEEARSSEGDPALKSKRRQRAEEIATNRMMTEVPKASVVIVNPTHYAVALKWDRSDRRAPIVVAKGVEEVALRIRRVAEESSVPIYSDPITARTLEADVALNQEIDPGHYKAVAAAIRFADTIRKKARDRSG